MKMIENSVWSRTDSTCKGSEMPRSLECVEGGEKVPGAGVEAMGASGMRRGCLCISSPLHAPSCLETSHNAHFYTRKMPSCFPPHGLCTPSLEHSFPVGCLILQVSAQMSPPPRGPPDHPGALYRSALFYCLHFGHH